MFKPRRVWLWTMLAAVALATLFVSMGGTATAQGDVTPQTATPQPSPTNNGGSAQWTINAMTYQSNYPKGMAFALDVSSSGGKIVEAGVIWSHSPGYIKRAPGTIDSSGKISASWDASADPVPPWVGVEYWWTLKDAAGNIYETPHKYNEYADKGNKWKRLESEDVIIFWQDGIPDNVGPLTVQAMKEQRPFYYQNWGKLLNYKPRAMIFRDRNSFAEWNPDLKPIPGALTFTAGRTDSHWGATVQVYLDYLGTSDTAYTLVLHEVGHLYQSASGGGSQGVDWFLEGDATYFELKESPNCVERSKQRAQAGEFPSLQGDGPSIRGNDALEGYDIGCAFFNWLAQTYGPDAHRMLWQTLAKGVARADALEQITGLTFVDMDTAFRKWIGVENAVAPTPIELPTSEFPPTRDPSAKRTPRP
ncbi:MAG: hypothetical protein ABI947_00245 [Chloroflexota bacterium]